MDWYSRYVLAWRLANTLDGAFCCEAFEEALLPRQPEIFNSDQGSQFTAAAFTNHLERDGVAISMDGRGRALDNVYDFTDNRNRDGRSRSSKDSRVTCRPTPTAATTGFMRGARSSRWRAGRMRVANDMRRALAIRCARIVSGTIQFRSLLRIDS